MPGFSSPRISLASAQLCALAVEGTADPCTCNSIVFRREAQCHLVYSPPIRIFH
jgi:hypothetical protein